MDSIIAFFKQLKQLDVFLDRLTVDYGTTAYAIIGLIIFIETGLVVMPFLPGDSLLFACGAIGMREGSGLNPWVLGPILIVCAIAGDTVNYHVGKAIGPRVMKSETSKWLNKKHLETTHKFFDKYGGKTIILARFVPIVRTFAPFVAGAGAMNYGKFILFNIVGGIAWVASMMGAGMLFGGLPFVKKNFEIVVIAIVVISVLPMVYEYIKAKRGGDDDDKDQAAAPNASR